MKVELADPARRQAEELESWWAENRPAAPSLFAQELRESLEFVRRNPGVGTSWPTARRPDLRRVVDARRRRGVAPGGRPVSGVPRHGGTRTADAALAGCAARNGAALLVTSDADFTELRGLRVEYVQPS